MPLTGAAAARLYDDHVDAVHALLTRRVGPDASGDIVAETFEHALRSWERFDPDRGTERLFLFGSALGALRSHGDAERKHLRILNARSDAASATTIIDPLVGGHGARTARVVQHASNDDVRDTAGAPPTESGSPLMIAISELPPDDRDILLLSLWESCSQTAIAEALDLSVSVVRSALGRIRRELKIATTTPRIASGTIRSGRSGRDKRKSRGAARSSEQATVDETSGEATP